MTIRFEKILDVLEKIGVHGLSAEHCSTRVAELAGVIENRVILP